MGSDWISDCFLWILITKPLPTDISKYEICADWHKCVQWSQTTSLGARRQQLNSNKNKMNTNLEKRQQQLQQQPSQSSFRILLFFFSLRLKFQMPKLMKWIIRELKAKWRIEKEEKDSENNQSKWIGAEHNKRERLLFHRNGYNKFFKELSNQTMEEKKISTCFFFHSRNLYIKNLMAILIVIAYFILSSASRY